MMNNREKYKLAFSVLHASDSAVMEDKKMKLSNYTLARKMAGALAGAVLALGMGVAAYAYGGEALRQIFGWENNMVITTTEDANTGESKSEVMVMTDAITEPVEIEDERIIFIVNDEHIDITDQMSETQPFSYNYVDDAGYTHYWIVGMNNAAKGEYGFGEFIMNSDGTWAGGYSAFTNIDVNGDGPAWLETGKEKINCPW